MRSVFWIIEGSLAGRPGPKFEPWVPRELAEAGFRSVLSLFDEPPNDRELSAVGIQPIWQPIPLDVPPNERTAARCREVLPTTYEHISSELAAGRSVLVHCLGGYDRTGLVLAHFLLRANSASPANAIAEIRKARPGALSMDGWEAVARELLSQCTAA